MTKKGLLIFLAICAIFLVTNVASAATVEPYGEIIGATYKNSTMAPKPGDIVVTNGTSGSSGSSGITGHAGIVINVDGDIVTIDGYGAKIKRQTLASWYTQWGPTKVMRWTNTSLSNNAGALAASWALNYYNTKSSTVTYGLLNTLGNLNETYCSKIGWDAFYFGANISVDGYSYLANTLYSPYTWLHASGFTQVAAYNWA